MSRTPNTYKTFYGGYEELLTKNNYELWAPIIQRELEGKDLWGFIDGTRDEPAALAPNSPATDQLLYRTCLKEHRSDLSTCGSYLFNACSKMVQDRYLYEANLAKPKDIWNKLKGKLQGDDEESRSKLLTKFMTMKKTDDMNVEQFANKLKRIQALLNGANNTFITDSMILKQIFANAGPSMDYLTSVLKTTPDIKLKDALKRYELAEESKDQKDIDNKSNDAVSAMVAQGSRSPDQNRQRGNISLPVCPTNWNGFNCWFHPLPANHRATDCDALREYQRRYLAANNIEAKNATRLRGYPVPGALPRPHPKNNFGQGHQVQQKRPLCTLCGATGHNVESCPRLNEAAAALKKPRTAAAAVATTVKTEEKAEKDEVVSPM